MSEASIFARVGSDGAVRRTLRIGVSTRSLFDLEAEHLLFERDGVDAYSAHQLSREAHPIAKGAAFDVIERFLALNVASGPPFVEVVLLSRNSPNLSLRVFETIRRFGLAIRTGTFTGGRNVGPYAAAWGIDLFLSNEPDDVKAAIDGGVAAARLGPGPQALRIVDGEVRVALDGDAVVFSAESDEFYKRHGLQAFLRRETDNAADPMARGPFGDVFRKLSDLRKVCLGSGGRSRVRIAIVTSRSTPAHERVIQTLRAWGTPADEAHFVGAHAKGPILAAFGADVFFDDQATHVVGASSLVLAAHVPGPHEPDNPILLAG